MDNLISYQNNLVEQVGHTWHRYLYPELDKDIRLLGLKGLRGVGKTTMLLQYLKYEYPDRSKGLYVTADHPYFYEHTLFDLASDWYMHGGKLLLIDEVHKYPNWSRELKLIYDGHPDMRTLFTSSSALDLYRGESDLSRRLVTRTLHGLSFREYLAFRHDIRFDPIKLNDVLHKHSQITPDLTRGHHMVPLFKQYLRDGYFPFAAGKGEDTFLPGLLNIINTVLESDLSYTEDYSSAHITKIKKLLGVIADSAPFEPNISKIAERLHLGRNTVNIYLKNLEDARILNLLNKPGRGITRLQKPEKIYFENASFAFAFQSSPNIGTLREIFFMNQVQNAGHRIHLSPEKGDFLVDGELLFEVGGKNKDKSTLKKVENGYFALDDLDHGFANTIPLWLFGFLY
ncbi:MAG: AAA family ATPase [Balneolaceae bacterium]|nr:AAA family ATPase [Balneolaceae bacterium]